ncbi:MAG TPA: hypothetical protein VFG69_18025 [Nannocystaceae bacterium]|nr:hypothetical protein [Nannocystaceae bacterium]
MSSPREHAPAAAASREATTLQDLQSELGEVEWFGRRSLARRSERLVDHPRWQVPATEAMIWSRLLSSRE